MTLDFSSAFLKSTTSVVSRQDVENFYGFGLLLYIIHYFCQIPSPTAFITITTSAANRQDVIVYYTVTLAVPWCVPNSHKQGSFWQEPKTKFRQNFTPLINLDFYYKVKQSGGSKKPQVLSMGSKENQLLHV